MSPVPYLTPGTSSWSIKSSDDTEDLIADPFWRAKQSSTASADAILIKCSLGLIERSINGGDNWTDVTPTSDPPNDAGDAVAPTVGNCIFNQLDGSFYAQDEFVCMVTWQNALSEWRTWLYHSDDNFATNGTWTAIVGGSGNDLSGWNTPSTLVDGGPFGNGDWHYSTPGFSQRDGVKGLAKMSNTKYVALYIVDRNEVSPPAEEIFWGYCRVIDVLPNGTLSIGSEYGPFSYNGTPENEILDARIYAWDEDYFIIISGELDWEFTPPTYYSLLARTGSVNGQVITFGANHQVSEMLPGAISFVKLPGTDHGIISASDYAIQGNETGYAWVVHKSSIAYSLSFGSRYTWQEATGSGGIGVSEHAMVAWDEDTAAIFFNSAYAFPVYGTYQLYAIHVTVSRTLLSLSFGSEQHLPTSSNCYFHAVAKLSATKAVVAVEGSSTPRTVIVTKSGSTYTSDSIQAVTFSTSSDDAPYWNMNIDVISSTRWVIFWDDWSGTETKIVARIGYMTSATTHAYGTAAEFNELSEDPSWYRLLEKPTGFASAEYLICYLGDSNHTGTGTYESVRAITADLSTGLETKGLGISIGKGVGNIVWLTAWDSTNGLVLIGINLTTFAVQYALNLGSATESEMNAKTWVAYPFAVWGGYDNQVMIYGRMDTGGGTPVHIIYLDGLDFVVVENGWGANHCGALIRFTGGLMYAIRNAGASTKFYTGDITGLDLKSVLPFESGVDSHGMAVDPIDGAVVVCSRNAGSIMVSISSYPYALWTNITSDHPLNKGVNAVAIL